MTLETLNALDPTALEEALLRCCGASSWVRDMAARRPFKNVDHWRASRRPDWLEAFGHHPKIGDRNTLREKFSHTKEWAEGEQSGVASATEKVLEQLSLGNKLYEEKFGFIFIVCATGKTAGEMLALLQARLQNDAEAEMLQAMEEQGKITKLRLQKLLNA
jgi:2-oxo-4-hydroxy-4-carboxy-5-ureidoimidazoline decarboxylase